MIDKKNTVDKVIHEGIKSTIDELYMEAIMSKVPKVIVEGSDDIPFYEKLSLDIEKDIDVIAVENIGGCKAGCDDVVEAIKCIQEMINTCDNGEKHILGIIDRDSRFYRNEIPVLKCLFILNYYSFESHLANRYGLVRILPKLCGISEKMIDDRLITYLEKDLIQVFERLFYISLEALKNACIKGYDGIFTYAQESGRVLAKHNLMECMPKLNCKMAQLDEFANQHEITKSDLRQIAKGKWYLYAYSESILNNIKTLTNECKKNTIEKCQYCKSGKYDKCMYRITKNFQLGQVINLLLTEYDENEVKYIKERLMMLA